jgi:hypothetical protein
MRQELLEETIRLEIEQQADRFGVNFYELSPQAQAWLRSLVVEQLYNRDAPELPSLQEEETGP